MILLLLSDCILRKNCDNFIPVYNHLKLNFSSTAIDLLKTPLCPPPPISFFRHICEEYFRPGAFLSAGSSEDQSEGRAGEGGVSENKGSDGDDEGQTSAAAVEATVLRDATMRADYVNSINAFNHLPVRIIGYGTWDRLDVSALVRRAPA